MYNIANIAFHSGVVNRTDYINQGMFDSWYNPEFHDSVYMSYQDYIPVRGILLEILFGHSEGYVYFELVTFVVLCWLLLRSKLTQRKAILLGICLVLCVASPFKCWEFLNKLWLNPIQFPMRYAPHIVLAFLLIIFSSTNKKVTWLLLFSVPTILLRGPVAIKLDTFQPLAYFDCVGNGEYLDESFVFDLEFFESFASNERFERDANATIYQALPDEEVVLFPKLWYNGYRAFTESGDELKVSMGYSQFCEVQTDGYAGKIILTYVHPLWLQLLGVFCYLASSLLTLMVFLRSRKVL